ncbi:RagB/SusD family nutrient uptake outer membrane protein [Tenacibaculum sp. 190524A05c]|uniref:Starch-binding outer membrane protein, SusD/RagB family n=1 Tax=Tenacibaculum platacis TaxID=3137852 RepID=A0ABM9P224_9FLAO
MKIKFKNITTTLLLSAITFTGLTSCDPDDFLDKGSNTILSSEDIAKDVDRLVIGAYDVLQWQNLGVNESFKKHIYPIMWQGIRADDMISQWNNFWGAGLLLDDFNLIQPNNSNIEALWSKWFAGVSRANTAITELEKSDVDNKARLIAEAKFIRAFCYFELVRSFGGVPLYTENPTAGESVTISRATADAVYTQVENDLRDAISDLQPRGGTENGRASRGAAQALLAKVHLAQGEYTDVLTYTNAIIASGEYQLETNYADNWDYSNEFGIESVFEVDYRSDLTTDYFEALGGRAEGNSAYQVFGYIFNGSNGGFGNGVPRPELISLYDNTDTRKDATFITPESILENGPQSCGCLIFNADGTVDFSNEADWLPNSTDTYNYFWLVNNTSWVSRASSRKYTIPQAIAPTLPTVSQTDANEKVIRYAEVLLMHAEASLFGSGASPSGQMAFDMIRNRAYGGMAPSLPLTLENLKLERRKELATEGWNRFSDLVRWGDAATALAFKNFSAGRDELLPIPQSEIDIVGTEVLPQNPGY